MRGEKREFVVFNIPSTWLTKSSERNGIIQSLKAAMRMSEDNVRDVCCAAQQHDELTFRCTHRQFSTFIIERYRRNVINRVQDMRPEIVVIDKQKCAYFDFTG